MKFSSFITMLPSMPLLLAGTMNSECDDELVLLAENSPFGEKRKIQVNNASVSRKKRKPETPETITDIKSTYSNFDQTEQLADAYFMKAKAELDETIFNKLVSLLIEINEEDIVKWYKDVCELLSGHQELSEEFIGFLHPHQAIEAGHLAHFKQFQHSSNFFSKLDGFHLNKIVHLLEGQLSGNVTSDIVRTTINQAFKGHVNIADGLLALLPDGKPPTRNKEDFEDISELMEEMSYERLTIPLETPSSCTERSCKCICHTKKNMKKFCTHCNIKFSNGQIYVQTGRGLRFAKVTFNKRQQEDVLFCLNPTFYARPSNPKRTKSTSLSQNKDTTSVLVESDTEPKETDMIGVLSLCDSPCNNDIYQNEIKNESLKNILDKVDKPLIDISTIPEEVEAKEVHPAVISPSKRDTDDPKECDEERVWTREEDKMIMEAFQRLSTDQTFSSSISSLLPSRTFTDIEGRFRKLMSLLEQMSASN